MECSLTNAQKLIEEYNRLYGTSFTTTDPYRLFPGEDGEYEFKNKSWPCNGRAGVYLIMDENCDIIYVGQTLSFGYRFYQYFKDKNGTCVVRSQNWSKEPAIIVAVAAPDNKKYERLSLEEFLIERLTPIDNIRRK